MSTAEKSKSLRGGKREGAGRPVTAEPSGVVRVPNSLKPVVLELVADYKKAMHPAPAGAFKADPNAPKYQFPFFSDKVPAGFPSPATDYVENRLDLHDLVVLHYDATYFLRAKGQSMLGAGIHDGDVLVVDKSLEPQHGNVVIAVVDGEFTVKRLHRQGGSVKLLAENPEYPDITFKEGQELEIWGVVTNVVHNLL